MGLTRPAEWQPRVAFRVCGRLLDANPCDRVRVPVDAQGEQPPRVLTPEEAGRIIAAAYAEDSDLGRSLGGPFARLAFASGLRMGELLALEYGPHGLDLEAGVVRVRASLDRVRDETGVYRRQPPKSKASRRDVPLPAETVRALREHRLATGRPADGSAVFARPDGGQWTPSAPYRAFRLARRKPPASRSRCRTRTTPATPTPHGRSPQVSASTE